MLLGRRNFLRTAALAGTGGLLGSGFTSLFAANSRRPVAVDLPLAAHDSVVLDWLRTFASDVRLLGRTVFARLHGNTEATGRWLASVADLSTLGGILSTAPFAGLYVEGSTLYFSTGGRQVTVELLPQEAFDLALAELTRGRVGFDQDSLVYDPATGMMQDPLRSRTARRLRLTRGKKDVVEAFAQVLDGLIEAREQRITVAPGFLRMRARVLGIKVKRPEVAEQICATLFGRFATWASVAPPSQVEKILKSRLLSTSLKLALGVDVRASIAAAKAELGKDAAPNPDVWIRALLGPEPYGIAATWLVTGSRFDQLRSRATLASLRLGSE